MENLYVSIILSLGMFLCWCLPVQCSSTRNGTDSFFTEIQELFERYSANLTEEMLIPQNISMIGAHFNCPSSVSPTIPKSVHLLRPGDIKVIGAVGDSLTAAYAAGATSYSPVLFEYPGLSASMGGDKTLEKVLTIPNIFRKYNSHLYGYSTGISVLETQPKNKRLNLAISGSVAEEMPEQVRQLIRKMKNDPIVDFENDWKFITILIGGNDLCSGCLYSESTPEDYIRFLDETIQILHDNCPRTFVNVIAMFTANQAVKLRGPLICDIMVSYYCPCILGGSIPENLVYLKSREFQRLLRTLVESGKFDDKEDFAAVYQPFFEDTLLPELPNGRVDRSFIAPDCFHPSQKGQAAQATANWNNLFEPVGSKDTSYDKGETINCPSTDFPYLYTNINSKPGFADHIHRASLGDNRLQKTNSSPTSKLDGLEDNNIRQIIS
ncbi:phospholipase B1, membrane-associated-like [Lytechinus variegatus]|uniref:phospholipase B1, membrane-associated-like n=1 Tax=Lytechinus variegatus TaxID=7654 RepID=UPI001BB2CEBA|nr:phospholipase B1, membrane-associated-like [Lytechinus variegatus]